MSTHRSPLVPASMSDDGLVNGMKNKHYYCKNHLLLFKGYIIRNSEFKSKYIKAKPNIMYEINIIYFHN